MLEFVSSTNFSREATRSLLYFHLVMHALNFEKNVKIYRVIGLVLRHFRPTIFYDLITFYSKINDFLDPE